VAVSHSTSTELLLLLLQQLLLLCCFRCRCCKWRRWQRAAAVATTGQNRSYFKWSPNYTHFFFCLRV